MSKATNINKRAKQTKRKTAKRPPDRRRRNPAWGKTLNLDLGAAEAIGMIGLGLCILFPGLAEKVQEVLDKKDEQQAKCTCICHVPHFDSMPAECECPVDEQGMLTDEHCKHLGRLFDIHGGQTFCHKCRCLKKCGAVA